MNIIAPVKIPGFLHHEEVVVCSYDKRYHYGLAVLANSLAESDFKGIIYVAYKDALPPWINQLRYFDGNYYLTNNTLIYFEFVEPAVHLAFYKPYLIKRAFGKFPLATKIFYFDVDIVVTAKWSFFSNWLHNDVCLCLDGSYNFVHQNHPWRKDWKKLADMKDIINPIDCYVNSGFIGLTKNHTKLVDKWIELTESYGQWGGDLKEVDQQGHNSYKGDQDLLNAAITVLPEIELSIIGKEGMGFKQPAYLMSHSVAKIKPWDKDYLTFLMQWGSKPAYSEKHFFNYCKTPIRVFSKFDYFVKKSNLLVASFLGRYIGY